MSPVVWNGMYGLLCDFGESLWSCGEKFGDFGIALKCLEIALGNSGIALIRLYEGDIGELLEIFGFFLEHWQPASVTPSILTPWYPESSHQPILGRRRESWKQVLLLQNLRHIFPAFGNCGGSALYLKDWQNRLLEHSVEDVVQPFLRSKLSLHHDDVVATPALRKPPITGT